MIIRKAKVREFTQIDNYPINDPNLSWKAKGILLHLLSKRDGWDFYETVMAKSAKDGRDSLRSGIKELENNGYLVRTRVRGAKGYFQEYEYLVYETPQKVASEAQNIQSGKSHLGESATSNTDSTKTDILKTYNTLSSVVSKSSKDKSKNPAKKSEVDDSRGLVYSLYRKLNPGAEDPEPEEALVAGMIVRDDLTHYLGKRAIPIFIQGLIEAREKIEQGEDADSHTVVEVAKRLRDRYCRIEL